MIESCKLSWCPCDEQAGCGFCAKDGDHDDKCVAHNEASRPAGGETRVLPTHGRKPRTPRMEHG